MNLRRLPEAKPVRAGVAALLQHADRARLQATITDCAEEEVLPLMDRPSHAR